MSVHVGEVDMVVDDLVCSSNECIYTWVGLGASYSYQPIKALQHFLKFKLSNGKYWKSSHSLAVDRKVDINIQCCSLQ